MVFNDDDDFDEILKALLIICCTFNETHQTKQTSISLLPSSSIVFVNEDDKMQFDFPIFGYGLIFLINWYAPFTRKNISILSKKEKKKKNILKSFVLN